MPFYRACLLVIWLSTFASSQMLAPSTQQYCKTYYGNVGARLNLAEAATNTSRDGSRRCQKRWPFTNELGATLTICPPVLDYAASDVDIRAGAVLAVELKFLPRVESPIETVVLQDIFITNGSLPGPFANDAVPAVLSLNTEGAQNPSFPTAWRVTGTSAAFIDNPGTGSLFPGIRPGVALNCASNDPLTSLYYCGENPSYPDSIGVPPDCWYASFFNWNMTSNLDFNITFDNAGAGVELSGSEEWVDGSGQKTGSFSTVNITFGGERGVPSVVNYDFWTKCHIDYETAQRYDNPTIELRADQSGMPYFINNTGNGEAYYAANGTFVHEPGSELGSAGGVTISWTLLGGMGMVSVMLVLIP